MNKQTISIIAVMDEKRGIGYQGRIPWHIKEDLIRFKNLTLNKTVIFGRKTYESILGYYERSGRPMPKRKIVVVSREQKSLISNKESEVYVVDSLEKAIELSKEIEKEEVFISGGAQIFQQGIKYTEKLYLTIVKGEFQADTFFPEYSDFKIIKEEEKTDGKYQYKFLELIK